MRILVLAAHPDDEVLGCGGTAARLAREGDEVFIGVLGEGATSRYAARELAPGEEVTALRERSREAARILGARDVLHGGLPDNRFDTVPLLEIVKLIERWVDEIGPQVIYTQHGGDLNIDHGAVYRATLTAARPQAGGSVREIYAYEVPSSTDWSFRALEPDFRPNLFVDIGATLELKIEAMRQYETELREFPHPRSPEALRAGAVRWGSVAGVPAAEAFQLLRAVR